MILLRSRRRPVPRLRNVTIQPKSARAMLGWGIQHLSVDPPETIIVIDADCRLDERIRSIGSQWRVRGHETSCTGAVSYDRAGRIANQLPGRAFCLPCEELGTSAWSARPRPSLPIDGYWHGLSVADHQLSQFGHRRRGGRLGTRPRFGACWTVPIILPFGARHQPVSIIRQGRKKPAKALGARSYRA